MKNLINFFDTDSYKVSHYAQLPPEAEYAHSYIEARSGDKVSNSVKFFGLQYILSQISVPTVEEIEQADALSKMHFGKELLNKEAWLQIAELGYIPLEVRAIPEGTVVPVKTALASVSNTDPRFPWLPGWFETQLLRVWYPTSVATLSYSIKQVIQGYLEDTGTPESVEFKLHDFGSRGASTQESAALGGAAHLTNFSGTDTLAATMLVNEAYNDTGVPVMVGYSIPASEHSTITSWGRNREREAYANMIKQFGKGLYACVSDSYDIWTACELWKTLESEIIEAGGTLVIRPDSGDPVETPVKVVVLLISLFGYTVNDKGYKVLPDYIRVIQGDGVNLDSISQILQKLKNMGISADNIAFGMGGALLQAVTRDTYSFAMKMSAIVNKDGSVTDVYKQPVGDASKTSKKGILTVTNDFETVRIEDLGERKELMQTVWKNGEFVVKYNFDTVRSNG